MGSTVVVASGRGISFTYTFAAGDEGHNFVRFYGDANNNLSQDFLEVSNTSTDFWVMQKTVFSINVDVSSAIPGAAAFAVPATMQGRFNTARDILLRKDSETDWRAAVQFTVTTVTTFTATLAGGARPDPVVYQIEEQAKHFNAPADVVFVNDLLDVAGMTWHSSWHEIIIGYVQNGNGDEAKFPITIAHEMGHGVGLSHINPEDANRVMSELWTGTADHLTQSEARAYDAGPLSLSESPQNDPAAPEVTEGELTAIFAEMRSRLSGLGNARFELSQIQLAIVNLPSWLLALTSENTIWIDQNAAGYGWFIDATPGDDSEFQVRLGQHELQALPGSPAFGKADLRTVLFHEMGHVMGLEHGPDHEVMDDFCGIPGLFDTAEDFQ